VTSYTPRKRFPYASSGREYGRGGAHNELLARRADELITTDAALWTAESKKRTMIINKSVTETGISQNNWWPVYMDNLVNSVGGGVGGNQYFFGNADRVGFYYFAYSIEVVNSGAGTVGSRRRLRVDVHNDGINSEVTLRSFYTDGWWTNGGVNLNISFVTYLGPDDYVQPYLNHNNAASTVNITNTNTYAMATMLLKTE
jgi:hypothetical protein